MGIADAFSLLLCSIVCQGLLCHSEPFIHYSTRSARVVGKKYMYLQSRLCGMLQAKYCM